MICCWGCIRIKIFHFFLNNKYQIADNAGFNHKLWSTMQERYCDSTVGNFVIPVISFTRSNTRCAKLYAESHLFYFCCFQSAQHKCIWMFCCTYHLYDNCDCLQLPTNQGPDHNQPCDHLSPRRRQYVLVPRGHATYRLFLDALQVLFVKPCKCQLSCWFGYSVRRRTHQVESRGNI